jgi:virulence factor Mce-like protein
MARQRKIGAGTRRFVVLALVAMVIVAVLVLTGRDDGSHRLTAIVSSATNVADGQKVRLNGVPVGEVVAVDPAAGGHAARITLKLTDKAWPLPVGSTMRLRWGGTVRFADRYIALEPAAKGQKMLADGGVLPRADFQVPQEFDQLMATFGSKPRAGLKDFFDQSGQAFDTSKAALESALDASPPALTQASYVLRDLDAQRDAVTTIVRSGSNVLGAVQASSPDIKSLLNGAAATLDAVADRATDLQRSLELAPQVLTTTRDTLKRADGTLVAADRFLTDIDPGVTEIRRTASPLTRVLQSLRTVAPDAESTLASLRSATPDLNPLLRTLHDQSPKLETISNQSVKALNCLRPYTPEIGAFFGDWASFTSGADVKDRLFRAQAQNYLPASNNAQSINPGQAAKLFSGLEYGFPRPPGELADQPWFKPSCGYGPDAINPDDDPEARNTEPVATVTR